MKIHFALPLQASVLVCVLMWVAQAHAAPPAADDAHRRAAESFREAQAAFERRDFAAAAAAFEEAARQEPHPSPWLNAAEARQRGGDHARAAEDCDQVLAMSGAAEEHRADAERRLGRLLSKIGTLTVHGPRTALVRIDGGPGFHPPATRRLSPGRHVVAIDDLATEAARVQEIQVEAGGVQQIDVAPRSPPAPSPATTPSSGSASDSGAPAPVSTTTEVPANGGGGFPLASWISLGLAGVSAGVAGTFSVLTVHARDDYNQAPTPSSRDTFYRNRLIANVAWAAAATGVITSVVIWRIAAGRASVAFVPTPEGGRFIGQMTFSP